MASQPGTNTFSLPTTLQHDTPSHDPNPSSSRKPWHQRLALPFNSSSSRDSATHRETERERENGNGNGNGNRNRNDLHHAQTNTNASTRSKHVAKWWKVRLFRGMINDVRRRLPFYWSDWVDAWDYRVVPATVYMYFANILPALAFSLDMFTKTDMSYGVNEVLLASVLGSVVFAVFAAQPLVIVGVTGPITVFNYTVYDIMTPTGTNYFAFMALIGLWSLVMHWILAITNACNALKYVTRFSCDIFGFYVAFIYLQKGIQVLTRQGSTEPFYLSIVISLLVLVVGYLCGVIGSSPLFQHYIRVFIKDYGTPLTVVFFTGFVHIGRMRDVNLQTLPTSKAFFPTMDRGWFIHFWDISVGDVFIAIPFAILLTILFYFDHNVSSLIAQGTEFPLRKPAGFHWDIFLLGLTTGIAGLLGIPFPNGLIPQAPFHTSSLCVTKVISDPQEERSSKGHVTTVISHVVEQRFSNLAQGLLTLGTMTGPLLVVLHLIPQGVLAGLFFVMGVQALEGNGITLKILFLLKDKSMTPAGEPLKRIRRRKAIWGFVAIQLFGFGATFAITQTIAAVGFPIIILLLIPVRTWLLPRYFKDSELRILDAPTASPFTMVSVGGNYGEEGEEDGVVGSGQETAVQSGMGSDGEGVLVGSKDADADSDEARAERGEGGSRLGMKRRESWRGEGRSGRWDESGDGFEMQDHRPGVSRRSVSRQSK
ncbi:HCO3 transporter family-domain-containing protein [Rhexocercosporidium sp. MPI-PUGE-AT-0058]|nr:HCO3 transporter family-domain-containing protein [Rhexocercosporidium sp. MPI-PUGE-AT-0058]